MRSADIVLEAPHGLRCCSLRRPYLIRENMIFDTEIEGNDNFEVFRELWEDPKITQ